MNRSNAQKTTDWAAHNAWFTAIKTNLSSMGGYERNWNEWLITDVNELKIIALFIIVNNDFLGCKIKR